MRIGLISCGKEKLDHAAPAQDLYTGSYFRLCKQWISKRTGEHGRCDEWAILSAKYGLVMPDQVIEPYDLALSDLPRLKRERWEDWVLEQLMDKWGETVIYMVLMGHDYKHVVKSNMPMVEDVIECWTQWRRDRGMTNRRAAMSIGLIKQALKEDRGYY
jgi:hypothetical protein